jgi:hypothetical protein
VCGLTLSFTTLLLSFAQRKTEGHSLHLRSSNRSHLPHFAPQLYATVCTERMSNWKVAIGTLLVFLSLVLVNATKTHLRRPDKDERGDEERGDRILRLSTNQLVLGGGPVDPAACPPINATANCPTDTGEDEITSCRGCKYANPCQASGAGFLIRRDCQSAAFVNSGIEDFGNNLNCPSTKATKLCLDLIDPISCNNCEYGNGCIADQAGFDVPTECEKVETPPPLEEGFINPAFLLCKTPDPSFICFDDALLSCGENDCLYNSTCQAKAAAVALNTCRAIFDVSTCQKVGFGASSCVPGTPVFCGLGCIYESQCQANTADFSAATCEPVPPPVVATTTTTGTGGTTPTNNINTEELQPVNTPAVCVPATCPLVKEAVRNGCRADDFNPISCRNDCCDYDNRCLAAGAGFNTQLECLLRNAETSGSGTGASGGSNANSGGAGTDLPDLEVCPAVRDDIPCTGSEKRVVCRGCEYFNRCFASGAGFNGDTCSLKGAPVAGAATPPPPPAPTPPAPPAPTPPKAPSPFQFGSQPSASNPSAVFAGFGGGFGAGGSNPSPTGPTSSFFNLVPGGPSPSSGSSFFGGLGGGFGQAPEDASAPTSSSFNPFAAAVSGGNTGGGNNQTPTASPPKTNLFGFSLGGFGQ